MVWKGQRFAQLAHLGTGEHSDVVLAERVDGPAWRLKFKLATSDDSAKALEHEATALSVLRASTLPGSAYFSLRLPHALDFGSVKSDAHAARATLVMRQANGYWGSGADVLIHQRDGIDPRHAVWIWRRLLETLQFVHTNQWLHGDIRPGHLLLHPRDHGVMLIGWSRARQFDPRERIAATGKDLAQAAWSIRTLLHGKLDEQPGYGSRTPAPLRELLQSCCEEPAGVASRGAEALAVAVSQAAIAAFGQPRFIHFDPLSPT
ncbi:lipopolysaccharide kinase InaA family protein [Variovorax sp. VNK109]|uniref:lipopolysaccharide kinase InaA family protein n=1 Tax=Variovorax sp. VNK109 TaxID=3400919 RepID=UPI003C0C561E